MGPYISKKIALSYLNLEEESSDKKTKISLLSNGDKIYVKGSKYHESSDYYWYRISRMMVHNLSNNDIKKYYFL